MAVAKFATHHKERLRHVISQAIEAAFIRQPELAKAAGVSYSALRAYRAGKRIPSPEVARRIAKALRDQGGKLRKLAADIERLAGK